MPGRTVFAALLALMFVPGGCARRSTKVAPSAAASSPPRTTPDALYSDDDTPDTNVYLKGEFDDPPPWARPATPKLRAFGFTLKSAPAVDGSTSTQWLGDLVLARALGISDARWRPNELIGSKFFRFLDVLSSGGIELDGGRTLSDEEQIDFLRFFAGRQHSKTPDAYRALVEGKADLLLIARGPTDAESRAALARGVQLVVEPVALDALVFVVNPKNTIAGLTIDQVRAIYAGQTTRWSQLGPVDGLADAPLRAYVRESGSGSEELMRDLVMKGRAMADVPDYRIPTMRGLINHVASKPEAIGYTVFYYQQFMSDRSRTRLIPIDGVAPNRDTIAARRYPLTCEVVMVTRKGLDPVTPAGKLRAWMLTDEGQAVVRESGYVPIK